jgi:hypothetical protein
VVDEPEVGLVHQGRRLEGGRTPPAPPLPASTAAESVVDLLEEPVEGGVFPVAPGDEELRGAVLGRCVDRESL